MLIANWPAAGAVLATVPVIEGCCVEMFVDVACPKSCEFGDVHDTWSESHLRRPVIRGGRDMLCGQQWTTMIGRMADKLEDVEQTSYRIRPKPSGASYLLTALLPLAIAIVRLFSPVIRTIAHKEFASLGLRVPVKYPERVPNTTIITRTATATTTLNT